MRIFDRSIKKQVLKDLSKKIVILSGPRQCGKTTFAKNLKDQFDYLNYDSYEDRSQILKLNWDRSKDLIIFDELHKMPKWKSWLKGIYDKEGVKPNVLVTGSARLDIIKKMGDSLAGRHYYFHLHPFDIKELVENGYKKNPEYILAKIMKTSGFPEPFLNEDEKEYRRWRQGHLDIIIKQDLIDFELVKDVHSIQLLVEQLRSRVGSGVSINALAIDLHKDPKTIQRWLNILEDLFVIFKLTPYTEDIARSLKKEPKYYFYDCAMVEGDEGTKLENAIACALLKETHRLLDVEGIATKLYYLKVKGGREIDFLVHPEDKKMQSVMIESKWSDPEASKNFRLFESSFKKPKKIQLVQNLKRDFDTSAGVKVLKASEWLAEMKLFS